MSLQQACEVLEKLSKNNSRNAKLQILRDKASLELAFLFETALHPMLTYGVAHISEKESKGSLIPQFNELRTIRDNLVNRKVTGDEAKELLLYHIQTEDPIVRKWLVRAFNKNLRVGVSATTVNKAYPNLIPEFPVGLCKTLEFDKNKPCKLPTGVWAVEPKLDGLRCLALIDEKGNITFVSRNNKPLYNTGLIEEQLKTKNLTNVMLDGELLSKNWNDSMSTARSSKAEKEASGLVFHVFDSITMKEWKEQKTRTWIERKTGLETAIGFDLANIELVKANFVNDYYEMKTIYNKRMDEGYEGIVLKEIHSQYPFKRGKSWLKYKEMITVDLEITSYEPGEGRNLERLGAFFCDFKGKTVKVGSGYSDELREKFWKEKDEMIGKIIEVQAQEVTKDGSLRFPVFLKVRFDKDKGE